MRCYGSPSPLHLAARRAIPRPARTLARCPPPPPRPPRATRRLGASRPPRRRSRWASRVALLVVALVPGGALARLARRLLRRVGPARRRRFLGVAGFVGGVPVARLHRVLPARRPARPARARRTGCRAARCRTASSRGRRPSPRRASARGTCFPRCPIASPGSCRPATRSCWPRGSSSARPCSSGRCSPRRSSMPPGRSRARWRSLRARRRPRAEADRARRGRALDRLGRACAWRTADALPHGAAAVAVDAGARAAALRARRVGRSALFALAGLAVGGVVATQPLAAVAVGAVVVALAVGARERRRGGGWALVAALPGRPAALPRTARRSGTRSRRRATAYFASSSRAPPLRAVALLVDARARLRAHLADVDNLEPLALLAFVPLFAQPRRARSLSAASSWRGTLSWRPCSTRPPRAGHAGASARASSRSSTRSSPWRSPSSPAPRCSAPPWPRMRSRSLASLCTPRTTTRAWPPRRWAARTTSPMSRARATSPRAPLLRRRPGLRARLRSGGAGQPRHAGGAYTGRRPRPAALRQLGHPQIHKYVAAATRAVGRRLDAAADGSDTWRFEAESDWPPSRRRRREPWWTIRAPPAPRTAGRRRSRPAAGEAMATLALPVPRGSTAPDKRSWSVAPRVVQLGGAGAVHTLPLRARRPAAGDLDVGRKPEDPRVPRAARPLRRSRSEPHHARLARARGPRALSPSTRPRCARPVGHDRHAETPGVSVGY